MYFVSGATGQVGGALANHLLAEGVAVRAYVRSEAKGVSLAERGAEVVVGSFEDVTALTRALDGVSGAFLMQPNDFGSQDFVRDGQDRTERFRAALERAGEPLVVGLSSVGAQHESGHGPVQREHRFERAFGDYPRFRFVRAAYFMENWANVVDPVRGAGTLPTFLAPDRSIPMVSVRDVGAQLAAALSGDDERDVVELAGPEDYSPTDVAECFASLLDRPVEVAPESPEAAVPLFTSLGFSRHIAELVAQMYRGYADGTMAFEKSPTRGPTLLSAALASLLK